MKIAARKSYVTRLPPAARPKLKSVRNRIGAAEWQARVDLAAAYRLTALILRNHGTLTVGATIGEMFHRMYRLEREDPGYAV